MRIISGKNRGLKLEYLSNNEIRPTTDRVKESLFNIISQDIGQAFVLDLFAGTGDIGLEALSRGASFVVFNDNKKEHIELVKRNIAKAGYNEQTLVLGEDYLDAIKWLKNNKYTFDIIYLDPPFGKGLEFNALDYIYNNKLLKQDGMAIVETDCENDDLYSQTSFSIYKKKKYGRCFLYFLCV